MLHNLKKGVRREVFRLVARILRDMNIPRPEESFSEECFPDACLQYKQPELKHVRLIKILGHIYIYIYIYIYRPRGYCNICVNTKINATRSSVQKALQSREKIHF